MAGAARRVDGSDIVQSAWNSLFVRVRDGRIQVAPGDDLWQLLVTITLRKLVRQIEFHTAAKRSILHEEEPYADDSIHVPVDAVARDPSAAEVEAVSDELDHALQGQRPKQRTIIELRLQGLTQPEIAARAACSERHVRTVLTAFGQNLQKRLQRQDS